MEACCHPPLRKPLIWRVFGNEDAMTDSTKGAKKFLKDRWLARLAARQGKRVPYAAIMAPTSFVVNADQFKLLYEPAGGTDAD